MNPNTAQHRARLDEAQVQILTLKQGRWSFVRGHFKMSRMVALVVLQLYMLRI